MGDLKSFAKNMRRKADVVETAGHEIAKAGVRAAVRHGIEITPVDTSEHLSNWQVNLNNPAADALQPYVPGSRGSTRGASSAEAMQAADAELAYKKPGQTVYISNLGPAIVKLDQGWSGQFAGGFVPRMLVAFRVAAEEKRKQIFGRW